MRETTGRIIRKHLERIRQLNQEIAESETWLEAMTHDDPVVHKLMGFKGIGLVTACLLRAEIGRFDRFRSGKQLARFCGLTPQNASSGARQADAGLIRASNRVLRTALIEAAQRLMRFDPVSIDLRHKLARAGKKYNVMVAAVANRWVRRLHHSMQPGVAA